MQMLAMIVAKMVARFEGVRFICACVNKWFMLAQLAALGKKQERRFYFLLDLPARFNCFK